MAYKREIELKDESKTSIKEPALYHVILLNDDYTTMEFVVSVIRDVFGLGPVEASRIMMEVHTKGRAIAGTYTRDIARTKAETVMHLAFEENYPLKCILQQA